MRLTLAFLAALALAAAARACDPGTTAPAPVTPDVGAAAAQLLSQFSVQSTASYGTTAGGGCCGPVVSPGVGAAPGYSPGYAPSYAPSFVPSYAPSYGTSYGAAFAPSFAPAYGAGYAGYSRGLAFSPGYSRAFDPGFAVVPAYGTYARARAFAPAAVVVRAPFVRVGVGVPGVGIPGGARGRVRFRGRARF